MSLEFEGGPSEKEIKSAKAKFKGARAKTENRLLVSGHPAGTPEDVNWKAGYYSDNQLPKTDPELGGE